MEDKITKLTNELTEARKALNVATEILNKLDRELYDAAVKQVKGETK